MKRLLCLVTVSILLFGSCEAMFTFNAFSTLQVRPELTADRLQTLEPEEAMNDIESTLNSEAGLAELSEDPELIAGIKDHLDSIINDPDSPTDIVQEAAILSAEVSLQTSAAGEVAENLQTNVVDILNTVTSLSDSSTEESPVEALVAAILPDEMLTADGSGIKDDAESEAVFLEILAGYQEADAAYDQLGETLAGDSPEISSEVNMLETAANALVAHAVTESIAIIEESIASSAGYTGEESAEEILFDIIVGNEPPADLVLDESALEGVLDNTGEGSSISNILDASNLDALIPSSDTTA